MQAQQSWSSQTAVVTCVSGYEQTLYRGQRRTAGLSPDWLMVSAPRTYTRFGRRSAVKPDSSGKGDSRPTQQPLR